MKWIQNKIEKKHDYFIFFTTMWDRLSGLTPLCQCIFGIMKVTPDDPDIVAMYPFTYYS